MNLLPFGITLIQAAVGRLLNPVFINARNIGGFVADVTVEERHTDELRITDHPVERNAVISDHAFKLPKMLTITAGWSTSGFNALRDPFYVRNVYEALLALQESRQLIEVVTGKRIYDNMLIQRLTTVTNERTENALMVVCDLREVQVVSTQTTTTGAGSAHQAFPNVTGGVQNVGSGSLEPATSFNNSWNALGNASSSAMPSWAYNLPIQTVGR